MVHGHLGQGQAAASDSPFIVFPRLREKSAVPFNPCRRLDRREVIGGNPDFLETRHVHITDRQESQNLRESPRQSLNVQGRKPEVPEKASSFRTLRGRAPKNGDWPPSWGPWSWTPLLARYASVRPPRKVKPTRKMSWNRE